MMYRDPKAFISKYIERYQKEMKNPSSLKSVIEEKLKDSNLTEREQLETQYFLFYIQKNLIGRRETQKSTDSPEPILNTPIKKLMDKQKLLPERISLKSFKKGLKMNEEKESLNEIQGFSELKSRKDRKMFEKHSGNLRELKESNENLKKNVKSEQEGPMNDASESRKTLCNQKNKVITKAESPAAINEVAKSQRLISNPRKIITEPSLSPAKQSSETFSLFELKKVTCDNEINIPINQHDFTARSGSLKRPEKLRKSKLQKFSNKSQFTNFPTIQKISPLASKYSEQSTPMIKLKKPIIKKSPQNQIDYFSPQSKLSIVNDSKKSTTQFRVFPVIDPEKKLISVLRSASLEKPKNFRDFQLVKLFD